MLDQILSVLDDLGIDRAVALKALMSDADPLDVVKSLLGITGDTQDSVIQFVINTIQDMILSYINQETLPTQLKNVLVVMCVSYYKGAGLGDSSIAAGPVASVKRGDVQTSFAVNSGASASAATFNLGAGDDFFGWKTVLQPYRKLRW